MEKQERKQVVELLSTVEEGIRYTKVSAQTAMIEECVLALKSIGNICKKGLSLGRYNEYAELFDQIMTALQQGRSEQLERDQLDEVCDLSCSLLQKLVNELLQEKEVKKEILFLPYKASMWDSLESIWLAARADAQCTVYVMPIPYCDRGLRGEVTAWHCEADRLPDYVPVIDWKTYDLAVREPDVVYIHNPYDDCNRVTSVHPRFYSGEIKKHTNMLVYVPYFVVGEVLPQAFYSLPSYANVDRIIVQSEKMLDAYVPKLTQGKLVPLGSPKIDRVLRYKENKLPIPQEWTDRIGNKKVIFYNTSLSSLLYHRGKALAKMNYVFSCFKEREEIVLLWRPHPLTWATLTSMLPSLAEEYRCLEKEFVRQNLGILDRTADVTAAVAISDAYIGEDSSSLVHLFGAVGKPVFVFDMDITREPVPDEINSLSFSDCLVENKAAWFVPRQMNALCKLDVDKGAIDIVAGLPGNTRDLPIPYLDVIKIKEKIYLLPYNADSLLIYDLEKKLVERVKIPETDKESFDRMIHYQDYLFLKPKCYPSLVRYDLRDGTLIYYRDCLKPFLRKDGEPMFMWAVAQRDNILLLGSAQQNKVLAFNMDNGRHKVHTVGKAGNSYFSMAFDGKDYWLTQGKKSAIVRWAYKTGRIREYDEFPKGFAVNGPAGGLPFISIVCCGGFLLAFPSMGNMIIKIDKATGKMSEYDAGLPYREGVHKSDFYHGTAYYFAKKIDDTHVAALSSYDNSLILFNVQNHTWEKHPCRLSWHYVKRYLAEKVGFKHWSGVLPYACRENAYENTLDNFVKGKLFDESDRQEQLQWYSKLSDNMDGTCGEKVHLYILQEIQ